MSKAIFPFVVIAFLTIQCHAQNITDIDGNYYSTVQVGSQIWMKQNLRVTHFANGDPIPKVDDSLLWANLTTGAFCFYNNDSATNAHDYGALYNWYAVTDNRKICPAGWHVPTDTTWFGLALFLDSSAHFSYGPESSIVGGKMKETGIGHWRTPNTGATNSSHLSILPGGMRDYNGAYSTLTTHCALYSAMPSGSSTAYAQHIWFNSADFSRNSASMTHGYSVRCICDSSVSLTNEISSKKEFDIYPNPSAGIIFINNSGKQRINYFIYNLVGEIVQQGDIIPNRGVIEINSLLAGMYILKLASSDWTVWKNIIKE